MIAKGESSTLECKLTTGELHRGMESACAFMNSDGGWLLFGISPQMRIVGQSVSDATRREIAAELRKIEPPVKVETEYIELPDKPGKFVVALHCNSANFRNGPYSYDGRAFYRVESTTSVMPRTLYEERMRLSSTSRFSWENAPNPNILLEDIDVELLFQTLHDGINIRRIPASTMTLRNPLPIMQKLGVANKDGSLNNAANVLFSRCPTAVHPQCAVRLARFAGTDKRFFRDQTICEGNLFAQYDAVLDFCLKHLNLSGRMDRRYREDTLTVPYEALREATANMLCHRSWYADNMTPSLAIYDDRMVFQNPGAFPPGTKWQDFVDSSLGSLPANPTIADVFYRRGTMEKWGRGIGLIFSCCLDAGLPSPHIQIIPPFINLTIPFASPLSTHDASEVTGNQIKIRSSARKTHGAGSLSTGRFSTQDKPQVTDDQAKHRQNTEQAYGAVSPSTGVFPIHDESDPTDNQSKLRQSTEQAYGAVSPSTGVFPIHDESDPTDNQSKLRQSTEKTHGAISPSGGAFSTHDDPKLTGDQARLRQNTEKTHGAVSPSTGIFSTHDTSDITDNQIKYRSDEEKAYGREFPSSEPLSLHDGADVGGYQSGFFSDTEGVYGVVSPSREAFSTHDTSKLTGNQSKPRQNTGKVYGAVSPSARTFSTHDTSKLTDNQAKLRQNTGKSHGAISPSAGSFSTHDTLKLTNSQVKLRQNTGKSHGATSPSTGPFSTHDESEVIHSKILIKDKKIKAKILQYCAQPRTLREIAGMLGLTNLRWVRRRYLVPLLKEGLRHTIPQRPTSHYQKYVASVPSRRKNK